MVLSRASVLSMVTLVCLASLASAIRIPENGGLIVGETASIPSARMLIDDENATGIPELVDEMETDKPSNATTSPTTVAPTVADTPEPTAEEVTDAPETTKAPKPPKVPETPEPTTTVEEGTPEPTDFNGTDAPELGTDAPTDLETTIDDTEDDELITGGARGVASSAIMSKWNVGMAFSVVGYLVLG